MRPLEGAGFRTVYIKEGKVLAMASGEEVDQETQRRESYWRTKSSQAVLEFFRSTKIGMLKSGVVRRGEEVL